ncbi:MAG: phosphatase PAP2 family protein [Ignavibacteriae bacterium]|nr:MAG: phosphatase PAP2 family protein [Ignavibacteriota bacterium]
MTKKLKKLISYLAPVDVVSVVFMLFLIGLNLIFLGRVSVWLEIVVINLLVIAVIFSLAYLAETKKTKLLMGIHRFYSYAFVLFVFKEIYLMVRPIHPVDYDGLFISIDHWLFGVNPTQWMAQFAHPLLTEIFQIAYFSYYILFLMLGIELYCRYAIEDFDHGAFLVVYGFYLSYLGYFLLPAVGPRFTLHNFLLLDRELPGLLLTTPMRDFINAGESISSALPNAAQFVQRDVFPSGHTQLTLIVVFLGHHYRLKTRWIMTVLAGLLIIGTIYLRYHYVVDLFGGALFFLFTIWSGRRIQVWWESFKKKLRIQNE